MAIEWLSFMQKEGQAFHEMGFLSHGKYIILLDADNPTNAQTIMSIVKHLRRGYDIIVGSRAHRLSVLNSPSSLPRGAQRRVFNRFVKLLLM